MNGNKFGIDIGTGSIKIYNHDKATILNERDMIAIENKKNVYAVGNEAYNMYEKAPDSIRIFAPLVNGVIADIDNMKQLFRSMMEQSGGLHVKNSTYLIAVPCDVTEVEKRAYYDLVLMSGLREKKIIFVEKPIADAIGVGLDVNHAQGIMTVNVGADTTEVSILSLGGIVLSRLLKTGGNRFDEAIQSVIRKQHNLYIGRKTAEAIKIQLTQAPLEEHHVMKVVGRDVVSGLPATREIDSDFIWETLNEPLTSIVDTVKMILERTPPELAADIIDNGIYLTGGSSGIHSFADKIRQATDLRVNCFEHPEESVIRGLARIISEKQFENTKREMNEKKYH